jgi:peptide/nickel transport system substrate-binding protein
MNTKLTLALVSALLVSTSAMAADLRVGVQNLPPFLDPGKDFSNTGSQMYYNAFDPLIEKDYTKPQATFKPGIATSWKQVSPTVFEVKIRQDVKFQNGDPMTAEDVVFTFERLLQDMTPEFAGIHRQFFQNFIKVEALDKETVRFTSEKPEPLFITLLNTSEGSIVPKNYIMGLTGDSKKAEVSDFDAFALKPIGTGPYQITDYTPGEALTYKRFDGFFGEKAPFQTVSVRRIPEMAARTTALGNGEVDMITNVPPDQLDAISSNPALKVEGSVTPLFHVVIFNTRNGVMKDKRIREALSMAIDRNLLNEALWLGKAVVPNTHTFPQYGALYMPELNTFEYNPDKAKELLKEAGYKGEPVRYDTESSYYTNGLLAAQAIKEMWAAVGVPMNINVTPKWTAEDADMDSRNWSNPMYFADPVGSFGTMWAPKGAGTEASWSSTPAYDAMWEKFRYSTDVAVRKQAYAEMMAHVKDEAPFIPLYQPYESYGMTKKLDWKPLPGHIPYVLDFRAGAVSIATN